MVKPEISLLKVVVRGGVEPPTFRFSGLRITVQDWPWRSICLLSDLRYTPKDAGVRRCMRLGMRLSSGPTLGRLPAPDSILSARHQAARLCQPSFMPAPRFGVTDRPGDILDRSGRWLAEQLGWRWVKSRHALEVQARRQVRRLVLQPSKWNRAGVATRASTRVMVLDEDLRAWRKVHPAGSVLPFSEYPVRPHVYNTMLINVELDLAEVECSGLPQGFPVPRAMRLDDFAAAYRERALPVLDLFQSPALLARELPSSWLSMVTEGTIEWALACQDRDAAALLLRRHMERPLKGKQQWEDRIRHYRRGWQIAPGRDGLPSSAVLVYSTLSLGWLARVHNLPGPETLREPASPEL